MIKHRSHWTCLQCTQLPRISADLGTKPVQVLNLYCGIGGNRKYWKGAIVTAVERDAKVAAAYHTLYPDDIIIVGDAHKYLIENYYRFDVIWSSPPCQSHTRLNYWTPLTKKRYPDLSMYSEIIFLREFFKGKYVVENVDPYYEPIIPASIKMGRHLFWSNVQLREFEIAPMPGFTELSTLEDKQKIMDWLGIQYEKNLYLSSKNYIQVFRNCVHPDLGKSIWDDIILSLAQPAEYFPQVLRLSEPRV